MKTNLIWISIILLLFSCADDKNKSNLSALNLLKKGGIPITIMAPDSATVQTMDLIVQKDISIKGANNYYVQIFAADATSTDVAKLKENMKSEVSANPFFFEMVREEPDGFIFQNKIDSTTSTYDFRYVKVKGSTEYRFQTGLIGQFKLEEVESMYKAIKQ